MKILVTGGRGFIGQALVKTLEAACHEVHTLDLRHHYAAHHFRADIRSFHSLELLLERERYDLVYHLAAEAGRWNGEEHYEALWSTNVVGTKHIIRLQEALRFKLVFMSSSEVYGDYEGVMHEGLLPHAGMRLLNDYAITKWVGELQVLNSASMFGTESVRIRMFNVYGPGEYFGANRGVVARFIYHALHSLPCTVYLDHSRTSTYLDDAVRTLAAVAGHFHPGEVYNIGGGERHDIKILSDLILKALDKDDSHITYAPGEPFTTRHKEVDTSKAERDLGHAIRVPLEEGIARTVAWARHAYLAPQRDP